MLKEVENGECSSKKFMAFVEDSIDERENRDFQKGLDTKVKLEMYKTFGRERSCVFAWGVGCWD